MSTKTNVQKPNKTVPFKEKQDESILFEKDNFIWMIIGLVIIFTGFYLMSGGGSENPNDFNNEIFSSRRIVVAPIIVVIGFIVEVYAILKKTGEK